MPNNFRDATDELFNGVSDIELADALGCSVASVRQARLREGALARRAPPKGWEAAVAKLADQKALRLTKLSTRLKAK